VWRPAERPLGKLQRGLSLPSSQRDPSLPLDSVGLEETCDVSNRVSLQEGQGGHDQCGMSKRWSVEWTCKMQLTWPTPSGDGPRANDCRGLLECPTTPIV